MADGNKMLKAVINRAVKEQTPPAPAMPLEEAPSAPPAQAKARRPRMKGETNTGTFQRPVREGKRFIGGHFDPTVARQLRLIAAEDDTTIQQLLEEAVDLLFAKKGRAKSAELLKK